MTESDKAVMQQALLALERVYCVDGDRDILSLSLCEAVEESIAALRVAIAQPVQPPSDPATVAMKSMPDPAWKGDVDEATYKAGWNDCCSTIQQGGAA